MHRTFVSAVVALLLIACVGAGSLHAQGARFGGMEVWAGYGGWAGEDYEELEVGVRGGGTVLVELSPDWTLGVEGYVGRSDYLFADTAANVFRTAQVDEYGTNLAVRRYFMAPDGPRFFGEVRGGWTGLESERVGESFTQDGFAVGPGAGLRIQASPSVDLILAGGFTWNSYGDTTLFGEKAPSFGTSTSAIRWAIRFALILGAS